jgi:hypothetical protein
MGSSRRVPSTTKETCSSEAAEIAETIRDDLRELEVGTCLTGFV